MHRGVIKNGAARILIGLAPLVLGACATTPDYRATHPPQASASDVPRPYGDASKRDAPAARAEAIQSTASRAVHHALEMVGKPYRYGGSTPSTGFDCSGLVHYSFRQAGATVARSTGELRIRSRLIRVAELRRGDLLFFDHEGKKNSHVAIYLGDGDFVHAPSSTKHVRTDALDSRYWRKHLSEARRIDL